MKKRTAAMDYLLLIAGAFIMGFAIKNIYDPLNLVTGGVSGLAIVIKSKVGVPLWLTNTLLNIPLPTPLINPPKSADRRISSAGIIIISGIT